MTINSLRYLKQRNLESEQRMQKEYFRDLIHSYGIDCVYFRKSSSFYETPSGVANYVYGEETTATFYLSAPMIVFMEMQGDAFLLNKFGIETEADASIYFTIDDFNEQFRDVIGTPTTGVITGEVFGELSGNAGVLCGYVTNASVTGITHEDISIENGIDYQYIGSVHSSLVPVNPDIKHPNYYDDSPRFIIGDVSGMIVNSIDLSGNGVMSGLVSGSVGYYLPIPLNGNPVCTISPQVGDFFRVVLGDESFEDFEVSQINNRNLQVDGLNPLLGHYIWRCSVIRRIASYENVSDDAVEEDGTTNQGDFIEILDGINDSIFDLDNNDADTIDRAGSASVYGDY